ncbi:Succinylornithine transaminase [Cronobacter sakazakii]|nr:Succinylornithine transaminase [Cronobacter sakazakii]
MSQSITRQNFDEWMIPVYAPAAFIPVRAEGFHALGSGRQRVYRFRGGIAVKCARARHHPKLREALETQAAENLAYRQRYTNERCCASPNV